MLNEHLIGHIIPSNQLSPVRIINIQKHIVRTCVGVHILQQEAVKENLVVISFLFNSSFKFYCIDSPVLMFIFEFTYGVNPGLESVFCRIEFLLTSDLVEKFQFEEISFGILGLENSFPL